MDAMEQLAERRIREAMARGELDDLPGAGRPLELEEDEPWVAPELRMAYRILKNAGYLPEAVRLRREISEVGQLLAEARCEQERGRLAGRLRLLLERLGEERAQSLQLQEAYFRQLSERLGAAVGGEGP